MKAKRMETVLSLPLPLAYRAIVPRESECANLAVVFCVSASHTGLSTLRDGARADDYRAVRRHGVVPVRIDAGCSMQALDYPKLRAQLLAGRSNPYSATRSAEGASGARA